MARHSPAARWLRRIGLVITGWPRLFIALAIAATVFAGAILVGTWLTTALLIAWDAGVIFYLVAVIEMMATANVASIRRRAGHQDVGQIVVLTLTAIAALASVGAIYAELGIAGSAFRDPALQLSLAAATFVLSWLFVHVFFALHYAHEFYGAEEGKPRGLAFPGGMEEPDYWDFVYFSFTIGMTSQVSDVGVTNRRIRRTVAAHGLIAFFFNVALLALVVNIAADAVRTP